MRFDWYQATVEARPEVMFDTFRNALAGNDWGHWRPMRGSSLGYDHAYELCEGKSAPIKLLYGGKSQGGGVHVIGSGQRGELVANTLRNGFSHRPSRLDVCEDYRGRDAFEALIEPVRRCAREHGVQVTVVGDWETGKLGRTLYVGSPSSVVRLRVYEKGKQLKLTGWEDWVRFELQVRPNNSKARDRAASASHYELFGYSRWSKALGESNFQAKLERVPAGTVWREADDLRAYRTLLKQYGGLLDRMLEDHGSPCAVGAQLFADLGTLRAEESVRTNVFTKLDALGQGGQDVSED